MSKQKSGKKNQIFQFLFLGTMVVFGGVGGYFLGVYAGQTRKSGFDFFVMLVLMYAAFFLQLILHEGGHLVFGLMSGYGFSSFRVGSFMLLKDQKGFHWKRLKLSGTGGQCLMTCPEPKNGMIPVILYNLGGALINVITGLLFLALWKFLSVPGMLHDFFLFMAIAGLFYGAVNGIPLHTGSVDNDGMNAINLTRSRESNRAFQIQLRINGAVASGIRPDEMPDEWFEIPSAESMKNPMVAAVGYMAAARMLGPDRLSEAKNLEDRILSEAEGLVGIQRGLLICDRIYTELLTDQDPKVLNSLLTKQQLQFMKQMKNYPSVLRTRYTLALLKDRDSAAAEKIKKQFDKMARTYPYEVDITTERELMTLAEK